MKKSMRARAIACMIAGAAALTCTPALAVVQFRITENGQDIGSFQMASLNASPCCGWVDNVLTTFHISNVTGVFGGNDGLFFLNASQGGGFTNGNEITFLGSQLYGGSEAAPIFTVGTYAMSDQSWSVLSHQASLTITDLGPAAPAPLAGRGLLAALAALGALALTRTSGLGSWLKRLRPGMA